MRPALLALALALSAGAAGAEEAPLVACGGSFADFKTRIADHAIGMGHDPAEVRAFLSGVRQDQRTLDADRRQGIFTTPFTEFARRLISENRLVAGRRNAREWDAIFDRVEAEFGVDRTVLLAFWAFETDYGAIQGDSNTVNALATLAHDCRRPELFQPQLLAALDLYRLGDLDPATTTGAWAGEIGMVQMLPEDILLNGVDGDGDGHVRLKTSVPDALMSGGKMLNDLGWRPNEPWIEEVALPADFPWGEAALEVTRPAAEWQAMGVRPRDGTLDRPDLAASIVLPQGKDGPAFLAYPNFNVFFEWNQSFTYVLTAAYFATRLGGAEVFDAGNPAPGLSDAEMKDLQSRLAARGHDVGKIDGILGAGTRAAVRAEQARLGLPADAWPTRQLLNAL
ncbi:lytic murein transglycosylase [Palleronia sediminis]|uniref:Lytic murein transglycosylase n=1 Tax=Palleronia sediminis TaxID=2547833 RepID=A0A4R6ACS7_9RHOB|nr:lytic murein transglycosylase [Palleronia sediminis]TDL81630.1 lytic murein transglycosylase [Palleronia sediminis]